MIDEKYDELNTTDKDHFARIMNKLLNTNYIVRDVYSKTDHEIKMNYDYRFIERNYILFEEYLLIAGWQLEKEDRYGVIYIRNNYEYNRKRLRKFPTLVLLTLRLLYDEEREKLTLKKEITITVHDLVTKMGAMGIYSGKVNKQELRQVLSTFSSYNILQKLDGQFTEADTKFIIYPSILFIISNAKLQELYSFIEEGEELVEERYGIDRVIEEEEIDEII